MSRYQIDRYFKVDIMIQERRKAQTLAEKAVLMSIVIAAIFSMQIYVKRGLQAKLKTGISAGVGLANEAIPEFESVFQQEDHYVYYLLRCVDDCQVQTYNQTQVEEAQRNYGNANWYDGLIGRLQEQCIQENCVDKLSHLLKTEVGGQPVNGVLLKEYLLPSVNASGELENDEAFNDDGSYNYDLIMDYLFDVDNSGRDIVQYEPYYEDSAVKYNLEQMNLEDQDGDSLTVSSGTVSTMRTEGSSGFDTSVDNDRW